jgi:hypothetical protein
MPLTNPFCQPPGLSTLTERHSEDQNLALPYLPQLLRQFLENLPAESSEPALLPRLPSTNRQSP